MSAALEELDDPSGDYASLLDLAPPVAAPAEKLPEVSGATVPHVTIHAFCETDDFESVWQRTAADRRLASATTSAFRGGFPAAMETYSRRKTPDLIIIETRASGDEIEMSADGLAEYCDPATRVIIVGHQNDILLYRRLVGMGVSNYLVAPASIGALVSAIGEIYAEPGKEKIGRIYAVIGAKGGVGASTVAQGLAFELAERRDSDVLLADLDLSFGTACINLALEPNRGLAELIGQADRLDVTMLDRVLIRRGMHLNLLGGAAQLETGRDLDEFAIERILEVAQTHLRHIVLDIPHLWCGWVERALVAADEVLIVATPELCSLHNTIALFERVTAMRPNDPSPKLVLNQVGMPRRQEIAAKDVAGILKVPPALTVPFDPKSFSLAAARGKTVSEVAHRGPVARAFGALAGMLSPLGDAPVRNRSRRWPLLRRRA